MRKLCGIILKGLNFEVYEFRIIHALRLRRTFSEVLVYRGRNFSVAESIQKENMVTASFVLRKYGLF